MKLQRLLIVCTIVNLITMVITLSRASLVSGTETLPVLRGSGLQIVDHEGRIRASIAIYPASAQKNGETYPETVLFRLITERGRPSVKLGASEQSAMLDLVGPTGTKQTYIQLAAIGRTSAITQKNEDGRELITKP